MTASGDAGRSDSTPAKNGEDSRPYAALGTILVLVVVIVVVLLYWRSCGTGPAALDKGSGGGVITSVPNLATVPGGVAVWVKPDVSIDEVLARNGLADATALDMGDGTYVISVSETDTSATIRTLKKDPGLLDAGSLYTEDGE